MEIKKYCLSIEKEYAIVYYFSLRWHKATSSVVTVLKWNKCVFVSVPQTVLHSPGIVHDRARGPKEQHTQASETPQDLHKTKHLVYICNKGQRRSWFLKYVAFGSFIQRTKSKSTFPFAIELWFNLAINKQTAYFRVRLTNMVCNNAPDHHMCTYSHDYTVRSDTTYCLFFCLTYNLQQDRWQKHELASHEETNRMLEFMRPGQYES